MNDIARIESAISFIPSIDRSLWVEVGMAVKSELGEAGRDIWDAWSRGAESYSPESAKAVWRSIKPAGKITVATLYHYAKAHGWRDDAEPMRLSAQQIAERKRIAVERAMAADAAAARGHAMAAAEASKAIKSCQAGTHPYLAEKGFPDAKALVCDDGATLVIPMRDCLNAEILGVQKVRLVENEWQKKFSFGMRLEGAAMRLGPSAAQELWFAEGYATGMSVMEALRLLRLSAAVVVCFTAGNLKHVAPLLAGRRFVFADNDESRTGEHAAWDTGLPYAMSDTVGQDANDLHQSEGLMAVAKKIMEARRK
jgi:putative DNA primase/helicase